MDFRIDEAISQGDEYFRKMADEKMFGDITVTITLKDGVPVKITKTFCARFVQRRTDRIINK